MLDMARFQAVCGCLVLFLCVTFGDNATFRRLHNFCDRSADCPNDYVCVEPNHHMECQCLPIYAAAQFERCEAYASWSLVIIMSIFGLMGLSCCAIGLVVLCYRCKKRRSATLHRRRWASDSSSIPSTSYRPQFPPASLYPQTPADPPPYPYYDPNPPPPPPYPPPTFNPPTYQCGPQPPPPYYSYKNVDIVPNPLPGK